MAVTIKLDFIVQVWLLAACSIARVSSVHALGDACTSKRQGDFAGLCLKRGNQSTSMEPENLDIEQINEDRRKAFRQNIEVISADDLKALGERLFPYADHPWKQKFFEFIEEHSSDTCDHAATNDGIEVLYCPATEKGMWYTKARGMGPLTAKAIAAMKEIIAI